MRLVVRTCEVHYGFQFSSSSSCLVLFLTFNIPRIPTFTVHHSHLLRLSYHLLFVVSHQGLSHRVISPPATQISFLDNSRNEEYRQTIWATPIPRPVASARALKLLRAPRVDQTTMRHLVLGRTTFGLLGPGDL